MSGNVNSVVFISGSFDGIRDPMGMRIGFPLLLRLEGKEIIRRDTVENFSSVPIGAGFDDGGDVRGVGVELAT